MNCKDLNIEPCVYCQIIDWVCVANDINELFINSDDIKNQIVNIITVYRDRFKFSSADPNEIRRCLSALISHKYKEYQHLLLLI